LKPKAALEDSRDLNKLPTPVSRLISSFRSRGKVAISRAIHSGRRAGAQIRRRVFAEAVILGAKIRYQDEVIKRMKPAAKKRH